MSKPYQIRPYRPKKKGNVPFCSICGERVTNEALFEVGDYIVAQKYCDNCLPNAEYEAPSDDREYSS